MILGHSKQYFKLLNFILKKKFLNLVGHLVLKSELSEPPCVDI